VDSSLRFVSFLNSPPFAQLDGLDVQVLCDLTWFAGLSDNTLATFER